MMEHRDIIKYEKRKIVQLLDFMKKKRFVFVFHFDGNVSAGDDDADDDASPLAKLFEHLAANVEYGCP